MKRAWVSANVGRELVASARAVLMGDGREEKTDKGIADCRLPIAD